jgi:hypothetical protein
VPPATVPFRLIGRHLAFPDLPGEAEVEVEVEVDLPGPLPGGGEASANDAAMPAANNASKGMKRFIGISLRGDYARKM